MAGGVRQPCFPGELQPLGGVRGDRAVAALEHRREREHLEHLVERDDLRRRARSRDGLEVRADSSASSPESAAAAPAQASQRGFSKDSAPRRSAG